jgi:histidine ammonia-lyase
MASGKVTLTPGSASLADLRTVWEGAGVALNGAAWGRVDASARTVADIIAADRTVYGINTGFGLLASTRITKDKLGELQRNLVVSHACGLGAPLSRAVVRLAMTLKVIGLARGHSGVGRGVIELLLAMLERDLLPVIPSQGSVGASGDLAPLAHLSLAMIGEGRVEYRGETMPAQAALAAAGLSPIALGPKEGLALLNGTQMSTAIALDALFCAEHVLVSALIAGSLSVDAVKGSDAPFDARIHAVRGQPGQIAVAAFLREALAGSEIRKSHLNCDRVQDPYSFRCQPQVMGACLDLLRQSAATLRIEANAVSDNPIVFSDTSEAVSGGNFHAEPVAFAADQITLAMCETGSISERRLAVLVDPKMSGLPPFLASDSGLNSGFMIPQVTAAALVAENRSLAFPASVDSVPTSANQEDHVSMATGAARKARQVTENAGGIVAIEFLAAAQGVDFHKPHKTSSPLLEALGWVRGKSKFVDCDRFLADEMAALQRGVLSGEAIALKPLSALARAHIDLV